MLQCWEGSEVAMLSEGVDDTGKCEELLVDHILKCWEGSEVAVLSEGVDETW